MPKYREKRIGPSFQDDLEDEANKWLKKNPDITIVAKSVSGFERNQNWYGVLFYTYYEKSKRPRKHKPHKDSIAGEVT